MEAVRSEAGISAARGERDERKSLATDFLAPDFRVSWSAAPRRKSDLRSQAQVSPIQQLKGNREAISCPPPPLLAYQT